MHTQADRSCHRLVAAVLTLAVCAGVRPTLHAQDDSEFVPVTDAMLQAPAPGDWPMWRRTLDGWGFRCRVHVTSCEIVIYGCSV